MVPNRLKYLRERGKKNGGLWLTLDEAAKVLGYSPSTVSRHENQSRSLSDEDVVNYSNLYKVRETELFRGLTTKQRA
jgi:transcriptional regulator with XRE-family HTH domain